jgi:hypothetical protein
MISYIKKALSVPANNRDEEYKDIIRYEAKIGGSLFGKVPDNRHREFFCLDEHTWVWHEAWLDDKSGRRQSVTTRYVVQPHGIFKVQANMSQKRLSDDELQNFYMAVKLYGQKITKELQRLVVAQS